MYFLKKKNFDEIKVVLMSLLIEELFLQMCFNSYVYVSILEDQIFFLVLIILMCMDVDSGVSGILIYFIVLGNVVGVFDVQNNGGNCDVRLVMGGIIDFDIILNLVF